MKTLNGITFLETKDIKKALQIGNKTCLDLFNKVINSSLKTTLK